MPDVISWTHEGPYLLAFFVFGYVCGTLPTGLILARIAGKGDIRAIGSGNIGATNVLRTGSKWLAALTLLGDAIKGTIAVLVAQRFGGPDAAVCAGLGAFLGHLFPVWLGFKGGKGIATYFGLALALVPLAALAFTVLWLGCAFVTRYSSLSALIATLVTPVVMYMLGSVQQAELFALLTVLAWLMHRQNIGRLLTGTESRIGKKG